MKKSWFVSGAIVVALAASGCAKKEMVQVSKIPTTTTTTTQAQVLGPGAPKPTALTTNGLHVDGEIAQLCGLPQVQSKASFDFDSTAIDESDRAVLAVLAKCMSDGALRGKNVALTGRADARGEAEYNMTLGGSRADSVRRYLHDLGVGQERLLATSRGELDATGTDEAGWAQDRRVDISAAN